MYDDDDDFNLTQNPVTATITVTAPAPALGDPTGAALKLSYDLFVNDTDVAAPDTDYDDFGEYDINDTVTAKIYIESDTLVGLEAYDIYIENLDPAYQTTDVHLIRDDTQLSFGTLGGVNVTTSGASNVSTDTMLHLQKIANANDYLTLAAGDRVLLATVVYTFDTGSVYQEEYPIRLVIGTTAGSSVVGLKGSAAHFYPELDNAQAYEGAEITTTHTVHFHVNTPDGATATVNTMADQTAGYNVSTALSSNQFAVTGYTFNGWKTAANSGTAYADGASYDFKADMDLYAQWTPQARTVTYKANGGSGSDYVDATTYGADYTVLAIGGTGITAPANKHFAGWNTDASGSGTSYNPDTPDHINPIDDNVILFAQWEWDQRTVTLKAGEGSGDDIVYGVIYNGSYDVPNVPNTFTAPANKHFVNWKDGSSTSWEVGNTITGITANVVLTAQWALDEYDVTFDANGHGSAPAKQTVEHGSYASNPGTITGVEGWTHDGKWYTDSNCTTEFSFTTTQITGAITLYAKWTVNNHDVIYAYSPAAGVPDALTAVKPANGNADYGTEVNVAAAVTVTGYTISDWTTSDATISAGKFTMPDTDVTLTATWSENDYNIVYDSNGGSGTISAQNNNLYTANVTLSDGADFTKTGYTLTGWNTQADGQGDNYTLSDTVSGLSATDDDTVTLYAVWMSISYTVRFHSNNGSDTTVDQAFDYDESKNLTANSFSYSGYAFVGWSTTANPALDATPDYTDQTIVSNLANTDGAVVHLYAIWSASAYQITYEHPTGAVVDNQSNPSTYHVTELPLALTDPTRAGYTFLGWTETAQNLVTTNTTNYTIPAGTTGALTFVSAWEKDTYTITYVLNDSDDPTTVNNNPTIYQVDTADITLAAATRTGYTFEGWYTDSSLADQYLVSGVAIPTGSTGNETFYAKWSENTYTIAFNKNGADGTQTMANITPVTYTQSVILPANAFTYTGYHFTGWKVGNAGDLIADEATVTKLSATNGATVTLYAQWEINTYDITVNTGDHGGIVHADDPDDDDIVMYDDVPYDSEITLPTPDPDPGYELDGYYDDSNNNVDPDNDGKVTVMNDMTITIKFKPKNYQITYVTDGSAVTTPVDYTIETSSYTLPTTAKAGYTFNGWKVTAIDASGTNWVMDATASDSDFPGKYGNVTLTAQWTENSYTIAFNKNGADGTQTMANITPVTYTQNVILPANAFTYTGYHFTGWKVENAGDLIADEATVSRLSATNGATVTLYAQWEINQYTVNIVAGEHGALDGGDIHTTVNHGGTVTLPATTPAAGYELDHWEDGNHVTVMPDVSGNVTITDDITITAIFAPTTYDITFVVDGVNTVVHYNIETNSTIATLNADPTKTGYTFAGWTLAAVPNATWTAGNVPSSTNVLGKYGDVTLTAQWTLDITAQLFNYWYAPSGYKLLVVMGALDNYSYGGSTMFYTTEKAYTDLIPSATGVYLWLVDYSAYTADNITASEAYQQTISRSGDINNDGVVDIADANDVYRMLHNTETSDYYTLVQLDIAARLRADVNADYVDSAGNYGGSEADVNRIINTINGVQ